MTDLFVDCPTGIAGDMLLAALIDLGVPKSVIEKPLLELGLEGAFQIEVQEKLSFGFRGLDVSVKGTEDEPIARQWKEIRKFFLKTNLPESLVKTVTQVFKNLAEAEASVHGKDINDVHFHEIGAIDALVDIVGVCAAVEHLAPKKIFCSIPPVGRGSVSTSHGILPVPVPAVLELAKRNEIPIAGGDHFPEGELTTPTGLALMSVLANSFCQPSFLGIKTIGVGLGDRKLDRPNFLRVCEIHSRDEAKNADPLKDLFLCQKVVVQEAWIDDCNPEDLSVFVNELRSSGAIDVVCQDLSMKKDRQGVGITALVMPEDAAALRLIWLSKSSTIGLRESFETRYILPRQIGYIETPFGKVKIKHVRRPGGLITFKPEHDDLLKLSHKTGKTLEELRLVVHKITEQFAPLEEWKW